VRKQRLVIPDSSHIIACAAALAGSVAKLVERRQRPTKKGAARGRRCFIGVAASTTISHAKQPEINTRTTGHNGILFDDGRRWTRRRGAAVRQRDSKNSPIQKYVGWFSFCVRALCLFAWSVRSCAFPLLSSMRLVRVSFSLAYHRVHCDI